QAPDTPLDITVTFDKGIPVKVDVPSTQQSSADSVELFILLNNLGKEHGIGRVVSLLTFVFGKYLVF
ncbi:argininosuccinate synthase, partial [Candidatus Bathyarchaeota archaeon]|nr:argininosuccinate synthase [Candidatus Bathyarchaeota archaeon]